MIDIDTIPLLPGEGEIKVVRKTRVRIECENCGEFATKRHTYLLENARRNPASSAYRHDDCSWCSDGDVFTCDACKPTAPNGMHWCSTFSVSDRFAHMFLSWVEKEIQSAGERP
jgi:hypothetical protein